MSLGDATGEEAALANVIVEMLQTPISGDGKQGRSRKPRQKEEGRRDVGVKRKESKEKKGEGGEAGGNKIKTEGIKGGFMAVFSPG